MLDSQNKIALRYLVNGMILLLLMGCEGLESLQLRVGVNKWIGYAPLYLSYAYHPPQNNEYQVIPFGSASNVIHRLRNRTLEAITLTLDKTITLANEGIELDIVLIFDISDGGDALLTEFKYKGA